MTLLEVQDIFRVQLEQNSKDLFYFVHNGQTASVIRHRLDQKSLSDLANDLTGLVYTSSADAIPKFMRA